MIWLRPKIDLKKLLFLPFNTWCHLYNIFHLSLKSPKAVTINELFWARWYRLYWKCSKSNSKFSYFTQFSMNFLSEIMHPPKLTTPVLFIGGHRLYDIIPMFSIWRIRNYNSVFVHCRYPEEEELRQVWERHRIPVCGRKKMLLKVALS